MLSSGMLRTPRLAPATRFLSLARHPARLPPSTSLTSRLSSIVGNKRGGMSSNSVCTHSRGFGTNTTPRSRLPDDGKTLASFVQGSRSPRVGDAGSEEAETVPYLTATSNVTGKTVAVETYGCQMNVSDTEIVYAVLQGAGYTVSSQTDEADVVLINTCAIRDNAENKVWTRLKALRPPSKKHLHKKQTIGVLGCMAERLKTKLLETDGLVDLVAGPDAYRDLPRLLHVANDTSSTYTREDAVNVQLSIDETYADLAPVRPGGNRLSAFVTIMRGCNHMCTYCIVPFTRGRERSRMYTSIEAEVAGLAEEGYKEVTLLGQNVNNFCDESTASSLHQLGLTPGFTSVYKKQHEGLTFTELLDKLSLKFPDMRFRYTSPHPKNFPDELIQLIGDRHNICSQIHLPAQSGNSDVLERMNRGYTREAYLDLVDRMRATIPDLSLSSDFISGFCGETDAEHADTLSLIEYCKFDMAFMFAYSMREKTKAHRRLQDDVPEDVKLRRLREVIDTYSKSLEGVNDALVGSEQLVLLEGPSKKDPNEISGRTDGNRTAHMPRRFTDIYGNEVSLQEGDYVQVRVESAKKSLRTVPLARVSTLSSYYRGQSKQ